MTIGIICEYNPFHNGHKYQIDEIRKRYKDATIIALCTTCFTQRGEISILNKWDKANIALNNGIDIFIEFPYGYATQSADIFAKGALTILNNLKIDVLAFGSESFDEDNLIKLANTQLYNKEYNKLFLEYSKKGLNFATSMSKALEDITNIKIDKPNDLLGLSYVKQIIKNNYNITPLVIKRIDNYHNDIIENNIASASHIRNLYKNNENIDNYINYSNKYLNKYDIEMFYPYLKYKIISNKNNLNKYLMVDEGIENRIINNINNSNSWHELVMNIKTKRYTYNKINRMLIHILTSFTKEEANNISIDYIRVLGFNTKGRNYLNKVKKNINIITHYKKDISLLLDIEYRISNIYSLVLDNNYIQDEISKKPIIK